VLQERRAAKTALDIAMDNRTEQKLRDRGLIQQYGMETNGGATVTMFAPKERGWRNGPKRRR